MTPTQTVPADEGCPEILAHSGEPRLARQTARRGQVVKTKSFEKVIIDTTVMEKAVACPMDSRLLERSRQPLVKLASVLGITLRQNYNRAAPKLAAQVSRDAHANRSGG